MVVPTDIQVAFITGALFVDLGRWHIESEHSASPERSRLVCIPKGLQPEKEPDGLLVQPSLLYRRILSELPLVSFQEFEGWCPC